jgi:hypothetical protein
VQEVQAWLRSCPACAALAEDLRQVSAAVSSEPVPPRRRDFRLTPEQADRLQGSAVTRFLRRLSAPRARALGPAAAGVLSLGLVFVVAGYVSPDDGAVSIVSDTNMAPAPVEEIAAEGTFAPAADIEAYAADPGFLDGLDEHQAGTSARGKAATITSESELADDRAAPAEPESDVPQAEAVAPAGDEAGSIPEDGRFLGADEQASDAAASGLGEELLVAAGQADRAPTDEGEGASAVPFEDDDAEQWLIVIGAALVLGGGVLLLLMWLARRQRDPLLR